MLRLGNLPRHLFDFECDSGRHPRARYQLLAGPSTAGKEFGGVFSPQDTRRRFGYTGEAPVTWRKHRICIVSNFVGYVAGPTGKLGKKIAGSHSDNLTDALVSSLSSRQGPRSFTVSARISLSEVTPFSNGISDRFRELGLRLVPKQRSC